VLTVQILCEIYLAHHIAHLTDFSFWKLASLDITYSFGPSSWSHAVGKTPVELATIPEHTRYPALFPSVAVSVWTYDTCCVPMHIKVSCYSPELSPSSPLHFHCQILLRIPSNTSCRQTRLLHRMCTSNCSRENAI